MSFFLAFLASYLACLDVGEARQVTPTPQAPKSVPVPSAVPQAVEVDTATESEANPEADEPKPETPPAEKPKEAAAATPDSSKPATESIKRPTEPPAPPDRKEFDIKPDENGMIQFRFRNQAWPDLLRWLAEVSSMSLDWQELPNDFLNLATQRKYSIEEARDLFNRHLLARGYTMLEFEGVIHVTKTSSINAALVPKVGVADLEKLPSNRFVRVLFTLDTLLADDVLEELKGMLSTNGKMTSLVSTNRLDAMDAVVNLREIAHILRDEQSEKALARLAREFQFEHVRAADVKVQLEEFLGLSRKGGGISTEGMNPEQAAMIQQQQMAMEQQQQAAEAAAAAAGGPAAPKRKRSTEVYLVANPRQNSLIVHAPPDKIAVIEAFIQRIDVPSQAMDLSMMQARMRVYRLETLSPDKLAKSLLGMDVLEPSTKLEVDKDNNAIIAYASLADQLTIQRVIEKLDGSARQFDVIQLRRKKAEQVAGTIKFMMGGGEKKQESRRPYYWGMWDQEEKKKNDDAFRIGANVQDNQLLIWANESERQEINKLMVKLGEIPPEGGLSSPFRTIDAARSPQTLEYLKRLRERWEKMSPNELILPPDEMFEDENDALLNRRKKERAEAESRSLDEDESGESPQGTLQPSNSSPSTDKQRSEESADGEEITLRTRSAAHDRFIPVGLHKHLDPELTTEDEPPTQTQPPKSSQPLRGKTPPIQVSVDEKGNLVLYSEDPKALDQLESLMSEMTPPPRPYVVFEIKHTRPSWIKLNLQDYFKDLEKKKDSDSDNWMRWVFDLPAEDKKNEPQLGDKKQIRFVSDNATHTLMVIGADEPTLKTIRELITVWDVKIDEPDTSHQTKMIKVQYSKADSIVAAIKDAYRDLLSATDRTFQEGQDGKTEERSTGDGGGSFGFGLKGELSLGVDKVTNTIIVTAKGQNLMKIISEMIEALDEAAKPSGAMQVINLDGATNVKSLEKAIKAMMRANGQEVPNESAEAAAPNAEKCSAKRPAETVVSSATLLAIGYKLGIIGNSQRFDLLPQADSHLTTL